MDGLLLGSKGIKRDRLKSIWGGPSLLTKYLSSVSEFNAVMAEVGQNGLLLQHGRAY